MTSTATLTVQQVDVGRLVANPVNPRTVLDGVDDLAASVGQVGVQQPLTILPADGDGRHMIVAGHRRHAAAIRAGLTVVPCIVRDDLTDPDQILIFGLVENLARLDLDPFDEAEAYARLVAKGWTHAEISRLVGRSVYTVSQRLKLLKLSASERRLFREGVLNLSEVRDMLKTPSRPRPARIEANLTRQLERTVRMLDQSAGWLRTVDHPNAALLKDAAALLADAATILTAVLPLPAVDGDAPAGQMRGRLTCGRCDRPIVDHPRAGVCP